MTTKQQPRRDTTKRPNVWVVSRRATYAVKFEGRRHFVVTDLTQRSAVRIARSIAREFGTELLVQGDDGKIRFRDSHGNDPFPPKG